MNIESTALHFLQACELKLRTYDEEYVRSHSGIKFEGLLAEIMLQVTDLPEFQNIEITQISGQKFPDIVVTLPTGGKFGVEVKTTTGNGWTTMGGSIFESTRIEGIETIFLFFAQLGGNPIDYRYGLHERYIKEVKITHSPRYTIDMNLQPEETVFHQIGMSYEKVRKLNNPFQPFKDHILAQLGPGADVWWVEDNDESSKTPQGFRTYASLTKEKKAHLIVEACVLFPEIFRVDEAGKNDKYNRVSTYYAAKYRIVDHALRDRFSAGGAFTISQRGENYKDVPKVLKRLTNFNFLLSVQQYLTSCDMSFISEYCSDYKEKSRGELFETWVNMILRAIALSERNLPDPRAMIYDCLTQN